MYVEHGKIDKHTCDISVYIHLHWDINIFGIYIIQYIYTYIYTYVLDMIYIYNPVTMFCFM